MVFLFFNIAQNKIAIESKNATTEKNLKFESVALINTP